MNGKTWAELSETLEGTFENGVHRLTLKLEDRSPLYAEHGGTGQGGQLRLDHRAGAGSQAGISEACCLGPQRHRSWQTGMTARGNPAGDITYEAKEQNFIEKLINGVTFGCFCKPEMTVRMQARDLVSGVGRALVQV